VEALGWDPDEQPNRFLSGYGHQLVELYARLRLGGYSVSIGRSVVGSRPAVVASLEELAKWTPRIQEIPAIGLALASTRASSVAVIRGDLPLAIELPGYVAREFMPTKAAVTNPSRQVSLPLLPQRGLLSRDPGRGTRVEVIVLKAYSHNVEPWLQEARFIGRLSSMGLQLRTDTEVDQPNRWSDFRDVDVALCRHRFPVWDHDALRKPATKLANAWCAGAIPIVSSHRSYLEFGRPEVDVLVADDSEEVITQLLRLRDPGLVRRLQDAGAEAAKRFDRRVLLEEWWTALTSMPPSRRGPAFRSLITLGSPYVAKRFARQLRKRFSSECP